MTNGMSTDDHDLALAAYDAAVERYHDSAYDPDLYPNPRDFGLRADLTPLVTVRWSITLDDLVTVKGSGVRVVFQYTDGVLHSYIGECEEDVREHVEAAINRTNRSHGTVTF